MKIYCNICNEQMFTWKGGSISTLVGYIKLPDGHIHDDNCRHKIYICKNNHIRYISIINKCPVCDWRGKEECWCHNDKKYEEYPEGDILDFNEIMNRMK